MIKEGKILEDEEKEVIRVERSTYKQLLKQAGGWQMIVIVNVIMVAFVASQMYADYLLGRWSEDLSEKQSDSGFSYYTLMVFGMGLTHSLLALIRPAIIQYFSLRSSRKTHSDMIGRVLRAPINTFFDVTPIGRILNRFSKDLTVLDTEISWNFSTALACLYGAIGTLVISAAAIYWILIPLPFIFFLFYKVFSYSINAQRETSRIESVTKSPLISFLAETASGVSTIRTFNKNDEFVARNL